MRQEFVGLLRTISMKMLAGMLLVISFFLASLVIVFYLPLFLFITAPVIVLSMIYGNRLSARSDRIRDVLDAIDAGYFNEWSE
jgi:hypothetical protein